MDIVDSRELPNGRRAFACIDRDECVLTVYFIVEAAPQGDLLKRRDNIKMRKRYPTPEAAEKAAAHFVKTGRAK